MSSLIASTRRPSVRIASFVACRTGSPSARGRSPAAVGEVGFGNVSELFAQFVGAVKPRWRIWFKQRARAWRPERCATSNARIASTLPSAVFAIPDARPDSTARAASIASTGSDLPCLRRT